MYINLVKDKIQKMWIETEFPKYLKKKKLHIIKIQSFFKNGHNL